jgi:hypothetical protein
MLERRASGWDGMGSGVEDPVAADRGEWGIQDNGVDEAGRTGGEAKAMAAADAREGSCRCGSRRKVGRGEMESPGGSMMGRTLGDGKNDWRGRDGEVDGCCSVWSVKTLTTWPVRRPRCVPGNSGS